MEGRVPARGGGGVGEGNRKASGAWPGLGGVTGGGIAGGPQSNSVSASRTREAPRHEYENLRGLEP